MINLEFAFFDSLPYEIKIICDVFRFCIVGQIRRKVSFTHVDTLNDQGTIHCDA